MSSASVADVARAAAKTTTTTTAATTTAAAAATKTREPCCWAVGNSPLCALGASRAHWPPPPPPPIDRRGARVGAELLEGPPQCRRYCGLERAAGGALQLSAARNFVAAVWLRHKQSSTAKCVLSTWQSSERASEKRTSIGTKAIGQMWLLDYLLLVVVVVVVALAASAFRLLCLICDERAIGVFPGAGNGRSK